MRRKDEEKDKRIDTQTYIRRKWVIAVRVERVVSFNAMHLPRAYGDGKENRTSHWTKGFDGKCVCDSFPLRELWQTNRQSHTIWSNIDTFVRLTSIFTIKINQPFLFVLRQ